MNFKKVISTASALAITITAFASFAVTANAAYVSTGTAVTNSGAKLAPKKNAAETTIDLSSQLSDMTTGIVRATYNVSTNVDYTNTSGNRPGYVNFIGRNGDDDVVIASFGADTNKGTCQWNQAAYSIGDSVTNSRSKLSSTDKEFKYTLYIDLDEDKVWGNITGDSTNVTINKTDVTIDSMKSFYLYTSTWAHQIEVSNIEITPVEWSDAVGYTVNTTPYALISYDGQTYNTGKNGSYTFDADLNGDKEITISKSGYTTRTETITLVNEGESTYNLTPTESGVSFYEDFSSVNDDYGFGEGVASVSNGVLKITCADSTTTYSTTFADSIDIANKTIEIKVDLPWRSANNYGTFTINGLNLGFDVSGDYGLRFVDGNGKNSDWYKENNNPASYRSGRTFQLVTGSTSNGKTRVYVDGKYLTDVSTADLSMTGFTVKLGKGTGVTSSLDYYKVSNAAGDYKVTFVDGDTTSDGDTYLAGYSGTVTMPTAAGKDGYVCKGWSDGTNTYAEGTSVSVSGATTFTAVYEQATVSKSFAFDGIKANDINGKALNVKVTRNGVTKEGSITFDDTTVFTGDGEVGIGIKISELLSTDTVEAYIK